MGGNEQADPAAVELSIGELSERTGCPIETIRYYERAGVLRAPPRTASGRRVYGDAHVRQLNFARRARDLGFSLERIRQLMRLAEQPQAARLGARVIAEAHLTEVQQRMTELQRMAGELEGVLAQCASGAGPDCPILAALAAPR